MARFTNDFRRACGGSSALSWLIAANAIASLALWIAVVATGRSPIPHDRLLSWFSLPASFTLWLEHPWTLLSYMFVQYSPLHLIFNLLWLFCFGRLAVMTFSDKSLLSIYLGAGITGGVFYLAANSMGLMTNGGSQWLCGSSAAVIGIMVATGLRMPEMEVRLFLIGNIRLKWLTAICVLLAFVGGGRDGGIAAHAGGLVFGMIFAFPKTSLGTRNFFKSLRHDSHEPRRKRKGAAVARAAKGRLCDTERLDQLLDKMKSGSFESLSAAEKRELNAISARLRQTDSSGKSDSSN